MSLIQGNALGGAKYEIQKSLRFRASASAYLSRTPTIEGDRKTWTFSFWHKRGNLNSGAEQKIFHVYDAASNEFLITFDSSNRILMYANNGTAYTTTTSAVLRDPTSWAHIVVNLDTTQAVANNRLRIYINGVLLPTTCSLPQNSLWNINKTTQHEIGSKDGTQHFLDGCIADIYFIDGQALDPSYFGEVSAETGSWIPKKYTGTYGTNGFYLPFNDGSSLANLTADRSGNGNNWTANNISLTSGVTYDWMDDTPTNNFAVLNPLHTGRSTLSNANLTASGSTDLPTIIPNSGTWYFERGGVAQTWTPPAAFPAGAGDYNFGQRPFSGSPTHPTLCTKNLPAPSILNPKKHFDVALATGANIKSTAEAVFPSNFLEWIKDRGNANNHQLIDIVRGTSAVLQSNTTAAETTYSAPSGSSVGWLWKAGGAAVTNNAGSIQSQVSANPQAGFSIVTYTGTGANATVGHGLGVAPKMVIEKNRNNGSVNWYVWHSLLAGSEALLLNLTSAKATDTSAWNSTVPTSSVFSVGTSISTNANTAGHVAYCFAEIPGFSKIGSYTGNGSADGPFIWCGFRPKFVMYKRVDAASNWYIEDAARNPNNVVNISLSPNSTSVDYNGGGNEIDFLANGFKFRTASAEQNTSGGSYIFYAVAEQPFKYSNAR